MLKTILIDENKNSFEFEVSQLKRNQNIDFLGYFKTFEEINLDIDNVDLIIFDISIKNEINIIKNIEKIRHEYKNIKFLALSSEIDFSFIKRIEKQNFENLLLKPVLENILKINIEKLLNNKKSLKENKSIGFFSLQENCGKTTSALNLAYLLSLENFKKTCLIDFDFQNQNLFDYIEIDNKLNFNNFVNQIENFNKDKILEIIPQYNNSSLYVLTFEKEKINSPKEILKVLNAIKNVFDFVVIDLGSNIDEKAILIMDNIELILAIDILNKKESYIFKKNTELFTKLGYSIDKVKFVLNRYLENQEDILDDIEKVIKQDISYKIPNNYLTIIDAIQQKKCLEETNPNSNVAKAYKKIAKEVSEIDFLKLSKENSSPYNHGVYDLIERMGE